jgi:hypothetical protein
MILFHRFCNSMQIFSLDYAAGIFSVSLQTFSLNYAQLNRILFKCC